MRYILCLIVMLIFPCPLFASTPVQVVAICSLEGIVH